MDKGSIQWIVFKNSPVMAGLQVTVK